MEYDKQLEASISQALREVERDLFLPSNSLVDETPLPKIREGVKRKTMEVQLDGNFITCDHTLPPLYLDAVKEGMIHLLVGSYVKKPDSGVFSDWSRNNAYETLRSYWLTYFNLISGQKVETEARF